MWTVSRAWLGIRLRWLERRWEERNVYSSSRQARCHHDHDPHDARRPRGHGLRDDRVPGAYRCAQGGARSADPSHCGEYTLGRTSCIHSPASSDGQCHTHPGAGHTGCDANRSRSGSAQDRTRTRAEAHRRGPGPAAGTTGCGVIRLLEIALSRRPSWTNRRASW